MLRQKRFTRRALSALVGAAGATGGVQAAPADFLEEVVVTAQFIKQNLQDTPIAITAVSGDTLEARGHETVQDVARQAPNVTLTTGGAFAGPALIGFIRGVGQTDFNPALEPGVGLYVDDVYYSTLTGSILDLLDLERVEVLRGPQGTLSGKNSIGGSIKLYSRKPDADSNGYVEMGLGSYDAVSVRAAGNFTLIPDKLYARVAGVSRSRDGYVKRMDFECVNPGSGIPANVAGSDCELGTEGGIDYTAVRLAFRWLATDNLEINLSGDWLDDSSEAVPNTVLGVGNTVAPTIAYGFIWPNFAIPGTSIQDGNTVGNMFLTNDPYRNYATYMDPNTGLSIKPEQTLESYGTSLNVDWQLTDDMQLQSITGYREYEAGFGSDPDGSPLPVQMLYQVLRHDQFSQEFRFNGKVGDKVDYTLGTFWFESTTEMDARVNLGYAGFDFVHGPDPVDVRNRAVFANGIFYLTDRLDLAVGARYSEDRKDYTFQRHNPDGSDIQPCIGPPGTPGNPPNCLISSLNGVSSRFEDERVDYRIALSYRITDQVMAYTQFATGYKGGGVNPRPFYDVQAITFEPEELEGVELGVKTELFGHRMRVNAAVFFNEYTDIQLTLNDCTALFGAQGIPCLANQNAGDADVKGFELELDFRPIPDLLLEASYSYIDFEFSEVEPTTGLDESKVTPFTPETTWSLGIQYDWKTNYGTLSPRIDAVWQDDVFTAPDNTELGAIDDYTLFNVGVTWLSASEDWQLGLKIRNATDEIYYKNITDAIPAGGGTAYGAPALPKTWELMMKRMF